MSRKTISVILIIFGFALLLAAATFWLDTLTSKEPAGLGQDILKWLSTIIDILTWIAVYVLNRKNNSKSTTVNVSGDSPLIPMGENSRAIQINNGVYIEKL